MKMNPRETSRAEYVDYFARWGTERLPEEDKQAIQAKHGLDGVYSGRSLKIHRLLRIAYYRGIRTGVGRVWEAHQPIGLRDQTEASS